MREIRNPLQQYIPKDSLRPFLPIERKVSNKPCESIMCRNDELSWKMSCVGCLQNFLSNLQKIAKYFSNFC